MVIGIIVTVIIIVIVLLAIILISVLIYLKQRSMKILDTSLRASSGSQRELQQRLTTDDIKWEMPLMENCVNGADVSIPNGTERWREGIKRDSTRTPQHGDNMYVINSVDMFPVYAETKPARRMTNSSMPKLAKLKTPEHLGLNTNPIYESSGVLCPSENQQHLKSSLTESDDTVLYAVPMRKPSKPTTGQALNQSSEPIYSEALTPAMFHRAVQTPDSVLHPYGPIYAEPTRTATCSTHVKEVSISNFRELKHLGVGQFGEVVLAETVGLCRSDLNFSNPDNNNPMPIQVAIKKLKHDAETSLHENYNKEIKFMSGLINENIIRLLAVGKGSEPFIMMEYMENGDLNQLLNEYDVIGTKNATKQSVGRNIDVSLLVYASLQVANGMKYLAAHNCVHRDLATRNCLVGKDFIVKIGDFGMSRSLYGHSYYRVHGHAMLPIRWMATECFYGKFSEKTDVWSFGIVMWEMFTLCRMQPYDDVADEDVIRDAVQGDGRLLLEMPESCPTEVYQVMLQCWEYKSEERAGFNSIFKMLSLLHQDMS